MDRTLEFTTSTKTWLISFTRSRAVYFWVLLALAPVMQGAHFFSTRLPSFRGQDPGIWLGLLGVGAALAFWVVFRGPRALVLPARLTLSGILLIWAFRSLELRLEGIATNYTQIVVGAALALIIIRPPSLLDARIGSTIFAYSVLVVGAVSIVGTLLGIITINSANLSDGGSRLPWLNSLIGMDTRWSGPFGHSNLAGLLAASVVVIGGSVKGANRWLLVTGGTALLALTQSRTAILAAIAGLVVLSLSGNHFTDNRWRLRAAWVATAVLIVTAISYVVLFDPTFGGRTDAWRQFLGLWMRSPLAGVGEKGVLTFVADWRGSTSGDVVHHAHGHNLLIDGFARQGLIFGLLILSIVVSTGIAAGRALSSGERLSASLFAFIVIAGALETPFYWTYWDSLLMPLILSILLSGAALVQRDVDRESRCHSPTPQALT